MPNRQYTLEFKIEPARLTESISGNQAAKRMGIADSSVRNWIRLNRTSKLKVADPSLGGRYYANRHRRKLALPGRVMDLTSRRIVGWSMSEWINTDLVCQTLKSVYWHRKPGAGLIMHTDRGNQYGSRDCRRLIEENAIVQSMGWKASEWDNSVTKSFFKTLKVRRVYQVRYATRTESRIDLID